jgi:thiol:disulfide interchange protein DsbA
MKQLLSAFALLLFSLSPFALAAEQYTAGKDYEVLPAPVVTQDKKKIEVVEVFWYGCGHCYNFEPMVHAWEKKQGDDVLFKQSPAIWNNSMKLHARAFFTAKALGVSDQLNPAIFSEMNVKRKRLSSESEIAKLFVKNGVDEETFTKTFNSFGVTSQVSLADTRAKSYRIQGTPEMVVNGKYRVSSSMTGSQAYMLKVVDFLVEKERQALAK